MTASAAKSSMGTTFQWNSQEVAEVTNITGPNSKVDTLDVTSYGSANNYREFIATFVDGGEITVECNWIYNDTNGQVAMNTDFAARTSRAWIITLLGGGNVAISGNGIITNRTFSQPMDGKLTISFTIKISGAVTIT